jgi:hypothetical protein
MTGTAQGVIEHPAGAPSTCRSVLETDGEQGFIDEVTSAKISGMRVG